MAILNKRHEVEKLIKESPDLVIKYIIDNRLWSEKTNWLQPLDESDAFLLDFVF